MLYGYQTEAADRIVERRRQALFDDPGLGKTITVLGVLEKDGAFERPGNHLILATRTGGALTWLPHAQNLIPAHVDVVDAVRGSIPVRDARVAIHAKLDTPTIVIANHDYLNVPPLGQRERPLWKHTWDSIIIDESQRVLPTDAEAEVLMTQFWRGLNRLPWNPAGFRIPMSGTPDRGKLEYRYGTWAFMLPERYKTLSYQRWLFENFSLKHKQQRIRIRGKLIETVIDIPVGLKNPELWGQTEDALAIRRTKAEVAPQLPPKRYIDVGLPYSKKQIEGYDRFIKEFATSDDGTLDAARNVYVRMRQFATTEWDVRPAPGNTTRATPIFGAESPKRDWIIEWLSKREFGPEGSMTDIPKVIIVSSFSSVLRWLQAELHGAGFDSDVLDGQLTTNQRLTVQKRFQAPDRGLQIILLNLGLGDSIDLDAADDMIMVDSVNDPDKVTQVEDRAHRVSRVHNVIIWRLITKGTIDYAIHEANNKTFTINRELMDGRRGVDFERKVLARIAI